MSNNKKYHDIDGKIHEIACQEIYHSLDDIKFKNTELFYEEYCYEKYKFRLYKLEQFVIKLLSNDEIPFVLISNQDGINDYKVLSLGKIYFKEMPSFIETVNMLSPDYYYNELINVFITCCQSMDLMSEHYFQKYIWDYPTKPIKIYQTETDSCIGETSAAELFNTLVEKIRKEWKINNTRQKIFVRKKDADNRYIDYCKYVDSLLDNCVRLEVLRIDLFYKEKYANGISISDITNDLNHLFENKRCNSIFAFMKGYIAKLEYDRDKKFHYNVLFFFDDLKGHNYSHTNLAEEIGDYWIETITKNRGDYSNANTDHNNKLGKLGIGVINKNEADLIEDLKFVIRYFCKIDQFIRPKFDFKVRLLRRGNLPKKTVKKRGRPGKDVKSYTAKY